MVTGIVGDLIGCVFCGYAVNPIITLGMGLAGCVCGAMYQITKRLPVLTKLILSVYSGHILGNLVVKSIGLRLWLATPWATLALRIPTYLIIGAAEIFIFSVLLSSKAFTKQMHKIGASI
jgi:ECF transporter S component (folate family)